MHAIRSLGFTLALALGAPLAMAQASDAAGHAAHGAPATANPMSARQAYDASMARMHDDMMAGIAHDDADTAFAAGMLAHHVGAVEMARIQLEYGKDEGLRKLAQEIIDAQEAEINQLRDWLQTHAPEALPQAGAQAPESAHQHH